MTTLWHLVLLCPPDGDAEATVKAWLSYLRRYDVPIGRVIAESEGTPGATALARALGLPLESDPSLRVADRQQRGEMDLPGQLEEWARWGKALSRWQQEGHAGLVLLVQEPVIQGLFRLCFGLALTEEDPLILWPGSLLHLGYHGSHDRWQLMALLSL